MAILKKNKKKSFQNSLVNFFSFKFIKRTSLYYFLRLTRLEASIYSISAGFACGSMVSFTPFIGFHFILAIVISFLVRGNIIASLIGTAIGNPFTFPFIWFSIYRIGALFIGDDQENQNLELNIENIFSEVILIPMLIGSSILSLPIWFISFFTIRLLLTSFKRKKI